MVPEAAGRSVRRYRHRQGLVTWTAALIAGLFALPVLTVFSQIFLPAQTEGLWAHLLSTVLPSYLWNTLWLVLIVGAGVLVIGTTTAWLVTMCRFPGRRIFEWALTLPLAVPAYVMAYTYTDFLQFTGPVQTGLRAIFGWGPREYWFPNVHSVEGAGLMLMLVLYPYVYLLARAAFLEQSVCALEVSRTLGCNAWSSFLRVALPLARPAIFGGALLAVMETLADFGTVSYFGVKTFTTGIYRAWFSMGDQTVAAQLSAALLTFALLVLVLERRTRGERRFHQATNRYQELPGYRLGPWRGLLAFFACGLPLLLGFLLPAGILLRLSLLQGDAQFGARYLELAGNSFLLAAVTAILAVILAIVIAYGARVRPTRLGIFAGRIAGLGYAVPGSVIAVGVMLPFALFDRTLDAWMRETFGLSTGLLLTGGITALIFAYLVRFLAVSLQSVEAGLGKIRPSMEDAARSLGRTPAQTLLQVHAPLMWGSLLTAGLIVFVDVMKELPATLMMRPFNFDTLAVQAYNLAADERLAEAATPALVIVAVGLLPVLLLSYGIARSRAGHG